MQLVGSASYLRNRARRRLSRGTLLIVGGAALFLAGIAVAEVFDPGSFLAALPVFLGLGAILIGALQLGAAGRDSRSLLAEGPAIAALKQAGSDDYRLFLHVELPRSTHAEAILLGPHGALALGFQGAEGDVVVRGDSWFTAAADGVERLWPRSPSWQLHRPSRALQRLAREEALPDVPIGAAVVLVSGTLTNADEPGVAVVPHERLGAYLSYLAEQSAADRDQLDRLAELLESRTARA